MKKYYLLLVLALILSAFSFQLVKAQNAPDKDLTVTFVPLFEQRQDGELSRQMILIHWKDNNDMPKLSGGYAYMSFIGLKNVRTGKEIKIKDYATQKQKVSGQYAWNTSKTAVGRGDYKIVVEVYEFSSGELAGRGESKNYFKVK